MDSPGSYPTNIRPHKLWQRAFSVVLVILGLLLVTVGFISLAKATGLNPDDVSGANLVPTPLTISLSIAFWGVQLLILYIFMRYVHKRSLGHFGLKQNVLKDLFYGFGIGIVFTSIITLGAYYVAYDHVNIKWIVPVDVTIWRVLPFYAYFLVHLSINSLTEEAIFRCYPVELFKKHPQYIVWVAIGASLLFAAPHFLLGGFTWIWLVFLLGFSVSTTYIYFYWKRSIWLLIGFHNAANFYHFTLSGNWKLGGLFELSVAAHENTSVIRLVYTIVVYALFLFGVVYWGKKHHMKG